MKIVFLCRLFYPHIGGVEKHVMEISKILIKQGHVITVITERFDRKLPKKEIYNGITMYRINTGKNNKYKIWKEMYFLRKIIQEANVVHCHDVFFWYLPLRFLYPKKPVYTTFHGYESFPIKKGAIIMRKISEKLSLGNICIGDFIPKWYGTKPTFISYGGVHIPDTVKQEKCKKESAVFIGRLDEQTGALTYTKAIALVKKKYTKFVFMLIGDGKDRKKLERDFTVLGFQKDPERYFPKYHFAFVSRYLSILEAFAAKKLVFAVYDNLVKEDYLKMTPYAKWIVIAKDEKVLAAKIAYYLSHSKEEKLMIEKAYAWVEKQTWESVVDIYQHLWEKYTLVN